VGLSAGLGAHAGDELDFEGGQQALGHGVSKHEPVRLIDCSAARCAQAAWKAWLVYCVSRSASSRASAASRPPRPCVSPQSQAENADVATPAVSHASVTQKPSALPGSHAAIPGHGVDSLT
jgi:hypothetical protein